MYETTHLRDLTNEVDTINLTLISIIIFSKSSSVSLQYQNNRNCLNPSHKNPRERERGSVLFRLFFFSAEEWLASASPPTIIGFI